MSTPEIPELTSPVGVFDGGIGSFDLVRRLRAAFPQQDIIYLADRASFPYGDRGESELLESVARATRGLVDLGATSIVLASNAPSVTVLDRLRHRFELPILGIKPPVRQALEALPQDTLLAVAGAGVMVQSDALQRHIAAEAGAERHRVIAVNADALIDLVETGAFLDAARVRQPLLDFVAELRARHPRVAGLTLSSTHLPWLAPALTASAPDLALFEPADRVVEAFRPHAVAGSGKLVSLATQSPSHPFEEFLGILDALRLDLSPILVELE